MKTFGDSHGYEGRNVPTFIKYLMNLEIDNVHKLLIPNIGQAECSIEEFSSN